MSKIESAIINFITYAIVAITLLSPIIIIVCIKLRKKITNQIVNTNCQPHHK